MELGGPLLAGALLALPLAELYMAEPSEYNEENDMRLDSESPMVDVES